MQSGPACSRHATWRQGGLVTQIFFMQDHVSTCVPDWGSGLPREALLQVFLLLPATDRCDACAHISLPAVLPSTSTIMMSPFFPAQGQNSGGSVQVVEDRGY